MRVQSILLSVLLASGCASKTLPSLSVESRYQLRYEVKGGATVGLNQVVSDGEKTYLSLLPRQTLDDKVLVHYGQEHIAIELDDENTIYSIASLPEAFSVLRMGNEASVRRVSVNEQENLLERRIR